MLAKSKLNSIETLVSQALIDMEISHEEFITILMEKDKYEKMKDNLRSENGKYEIMRLSSVTSRTQVKNSQKLLRILCHQKKLLLFLFMYKMYLISAEGYKNAEFDSKIVRKTGELWVSMKDV